MTQGTGKAYERHWNLWCSFLSSVLECQDPLLKDVREDDKAPVVALFLRERYCQGLRGKEAAAVTAGIRIRFTSALLSTDFFDSPIVSAARAASKMSSAELRARKNEGPRASVKLPMCESLVLEQRLPNWVNRSWEYPDIDHRAQYVAVMYAYDQGARVGEYTKAEGKAEDHCVRAGDLLFEFEAESGPFTVRGGEDHFRRAREGLGVECHVTGCWVRSSTNKTGPVVKTKLIGRRTPEEAQFLDDLTSWVTHSRVTPIDELFSRWAMVRGVLSRRRMRSKAIRENIKDICARAGLDPAFFSAHSLRKAAQTHMRAMGVSVEDRRDRGNYSEASEVLNTTYDYSNAGHGPLSSSSLGGGVAPGVEGIKRYLPTSR